MEKLLKIDTIIERFEYAVVSLSDENLAFIASASDFFAKHSYLESVDLLPESVEVINNDEIDQEEYDMVDEFASYGEETGYCIDDMSNVASIEPAKYMLTVTKEGKVYARGYLHSESLTDCYFVTDEIEILNSK